MPSPYDKPILQPQPNAVLREFMKGSEDHLIDEVRALRHDIQKLRADLKPVESLILTGQQVAEEFKRLAGGSRPC
jgi:hypothetical protein